MLILCYSSINEDHLWVIMIFNRWIIHKYPTSLHIVRSVRIKIIFDLFDPSITIAFISVVQNKLFLVFLNKSKVKYFVLNVHKLCLTVYLSCLKTIWLTNLISRFEWWPSENIELLTMHDIIAFASDTLIFAAVYHC